MQTLEWEISDDFIAVAEHAVASDKHIASFLENEDEVGPALWWVKDEGIYLMSNGSPGLAGEKDGTNLVVYAEGFNPHERDRMEVWDDVREAVGGDDFAEPFPIDEEFVNVAKELKGDGKFVLKYDETKMEAGFLAPS